MELAQAIRQVHAGKKRVPPERAARLAEHIGSEKLTEREVQVLERVAGGNRHRVQYASVLSWKFVNKVELAQSWRRHSCLPRRDSSRRFLPPLPQRLTGGRSAHPCADSQTLAMSDPETLV